MAGMMIEYKFIIQREDRQGTPQWQKFDGNYRVTPVAGQVLQAVSDWEVASAEISTLEVPEDVTEKVTEKPTESDKAAAKQEKEEILLKMAESQVEKAAAEVTSTCPLAVTLTKREMSRRNFSQSLLTLDVDAPGEAQKEDKDAKEEKEDKEETEEKEKSEKLEKPKEPESTPQSTTATEEPKEPETTVDAGADVVVTQAPLVDEDEAEEYEVPLKQPDVRGVSLKHITCLGILSLWYRKHWPNNKANNFKELCVWSMHVNAQDFVFAFGFQIPELVLSQELLRAHRHGRCRNENGTSKGEEESAVALWSVQSQCACGHCHQWSGSLLQDRTWWFWGCFCPQLWGFE